jgi:uncharacterized protein DUF6766
VDLVDAFVVITIAVTLLSIAGLLMGALVKSILKERRGSSLHDLWKNFGLSIAFCVLFLMSWVAHGIAEWGTYEGQQHAYGEPATASGFVIEFGQSTLENWQSEFLQLFSFVVLSAILIHRGSAESKDGPERMEQMLKDISRRLDELEAPQETRGT